MFDISWSELLIVAVVTLIFVGPKDLPRFLNTMGRYAGAIRRQAAEFRAQFDDAMRQAELDALKKEVDEVRSGLESTARKVTEPSKPVSKVSSDSEPKAPEKKAPEKTETAADSPATPANSHERKEA